MIERTTLRQVQTRSRVESYCGACERKLGGPYGCWYPHDGMRFCPYCGVYLEDPAELEGGADFTPTGSVWQRFCDDDQTHPLTAKENERRAAKDHEQQLAHDAAWMCRKCGRVPDPMEPVWGESHTEPTVEERTWNPMPIAHHGHRVCRGCGDEQIVWLFDGTTKSGDALMEYRADEPQVGPLGDPEL